MLARQDAVSVVSVEMAKQLVIIHRVGSASLLTICRRNKDPSVYNLAIGTSVDLLDRGTYISLLIFPSFRTVTIAASRLAQALF